MKVCFCGCGRAVPRFPFALRAISTRGKQATDRLAWAEVLLLDDPGFADWILAGKTYKADLRAAVHGEIEPGMLDERSIREWQAYGRHMAKIGVGMGIPNIPARGYTVEDLQTLSQLATELRSSRAPGPQRPSAPP